MPAEYRARIEEGRPRLNAIAREQYGLELNQGPFGIDSRPALVGAKLAELRGVGPEYHARVMRAYWGEGQDIGDAAVLTDIAETIGLDRDEFLAALEAKEFVRAVDEDIAQAQEFGLNGVPVIVFAEKYLISGAQPYPVLVDVADKVLAELANDNSA
jgi:predicted DsbA family dithiol-disulfide isomerase